MFYVLYEQCFTMNVQLNFLLEKKNRIWPKSESTVRLTIKWKSESAKKIAIGASLVDMC